MGPLLKSFIIEDEREDKFPYDDIRFLMTRVGSTSQDFIGDLDYYFFNLMGYASWGRKILRWIVGSGLYRQLR